MSTVRKTPAGATRTCPHCRAVILQSASVCPSCRKHVRFVAAGLEPESPSFIPLQVEGAIRHRDAATAAAAEAWEFAVTVTVCNDRGEEVTRQVVAVGAIPPDEQRTFTFAVEVFTPVGDGVS